MQSHLFVSLLLLSFTFPATAQRPAAFEIASLKPSQRQVGADYNNRITASQSGIAAGNATLRRLVSEAYGVQVQQVFGPGWLNQKEYDIDARAGGPATRNELDMMLRSLLSERFSLKQHRETRDMRVYELLVDKGGAKLRPLGNGETASGSGFRFHGDMRQFADFLAVQFSIAIPDDPTKPGRAGGPVVPVLDKTGLDGIYDFDADVKPELGADPFTLWQRVLREQMGLRIESRRSQADVIVVDEANNVPTAND